ncbi:hypothetical protein BK634_07560 [Pseudomonas chlororaphis]|jgi:hypothetical protein|uniref:Uncharacterized protein n=1 Tax=Pseudomonas morbosilactucae TaxID=2938197 RepID=A0ABT0JC34_9PSED|nr:hypothetical protein [Pseudomonas morbosilactucae]MCK9813459.1 hypothetical protein [Pseudomonas morbosilactucae]ROL70996.1 hypothetical protein BK634_07560 [Pseudomonas chlororaphis]WEK10106.1 MAG: hypothetical protein P0Y51_04015 [Pseudomonas sp.]
MAPRIDRIAAMLNCPIKGADIRQAIKESRKDFELEEGEEGIDQEAQADTHQQDDQHAEDQ